MKGDRHRWAERILLFVGGILVGIIAWSFFSWAFDPKITLGEILGASVTILLAWVVSVLIERAKSTNNAMCVLMLARVEEIRTGFRECHGLVQHLSGSIWSEAKATQIVESLRKTSILLTDAEELSLAWYNQNRFEPLKQRYINYKRLVTDTGKSSPLTPDKLVDAESLYKEIRCELSKIIVTACN